MVHDILQPMRGMIHVVLWLLMSLSALSATVLNNAVVSSFSLTPPAPVPPITNQGFIDFEAGSSGDLITETLLTNSTHGTMFREWTIKTANTNGNSGQLTITNINTLLNTSVSVEGTTYTGTGTRSLAVDQSSVNTEVCLRLVNSLPNISIGTFITFAASNPTNSHTIDHIVLYGDLGGFFVAQSTYPTSGPFVLHAHSDLNGGSSQIGPNFTISAGTTYWLTMQRLKGDTYTLNLYETNAWSLVGTSSVNNFNKNDNVYQICFGRIDTHSASVAATEFYDDFCINTNAVFPLGP